MQTYKLSLHQLDEEKEMTDLGQQTVRGFDWISCNNFQLMLEESLIYGITEQSEGTQESVQFEVSLF